MDINALNANLNRDKWGVRNFRALKSLLVKEVQESLSEFMPLTSSSYYNNPIQVLDFFSGAGGTSLAQTYLVLQCIILIHRKSSMKSFNTSSTSLLNL